MPPNGRLERRRVAARAHKRGRAGCEPSFGWRGEDDIPASLETFAN